MLNILPKQNVLLKELEANDPELITEWNEARGVASLIRGILTQPSDSTPENIIQSFLVKFGELFTSTNFKNTLIQLRSRTDDLGWTHIEFQQVYLRDEHPNEPLEIYNSKLVAHVTKEGALIEVQSSCWREVSLKIETVLTKDELREILTKPIKNTFGFDELERQMEEQQEINFPIMQEPNLVIYPWQGVFRLTWMTYAFSAFDVQDKSHKPTGAKELDQAQIFVDASTGEVILRAPTSRDAETADTGSGLGVTAIGRPFVSRNLFIVRVDDTARYKLIDTTHSRDIITYDAANSDAFNSDKTRANGINSGTLPVSEDTEGDKNWNRVSTVIDRTGSQQPEVDLHNFLREAFEWYNTIGPPSRSGWDDNQYDDPPVPIQQIRAIAHAKNDKNPSDINANERIWVIGGKKLCWLTFFDGDGTTYDYLSGSKFIVGHEYQHAMTDFSFKDGGGNPGFTYSHWLAAVHEGISDVFGGLFSEQWLPGTDISPIGQIFRNLVFPRDDGPPPPNAAYDANNFDHFSDSLPGLSDTVPPGAKTSPSYDVRYKRGTILAHCTFLIAKGGVHQRASRSPSLIPVYNLGREIYNGNSVLKAARIWYRAISHYFHTHGATTDIPGNDEDVFRTLRSSCISSAIDIYGRKSSEHITTDLAFYAVGLFPRSVPYGADVTFLRWGADWKMSRPYIGISSPDWASMDLFINNGSTLSEWNAVINVLDSARIPTQFENNVYCRVRNVGDRPAANVRLEFFYAKAGTAVTTWLPMKDKNGVVQTLTIDTLAAGQSNFPDSAQNSPPTGTSIRWHIPPLASGEVVDHFCMKAIVTSSNDVNQYNNETQSNVVYAPYSPATGFKMAFSAGNPRGEENPLKIQIDADLPQGWEANIIEPHNQIILKPGEERTFTIVINMPSKADKRLEPPFDGELKGQLFGSIYGGFFGTLTEVRSSGQNVEGRLAANIDYIGSITGGFEGKLDVFTGRIKGRVTGTFQYEGKKQDEQVIIGVEACLRPWRRINITQLAYGEPIGGMTIQIQVPNSGDLCAEALPPTDTFVDQLHSA